VASGFTMSKQSGAADSLGSSARTGTLLGANSQGDRVDAPTPVQKQQSNAEAAFQSIGVVASLGSGTLRANSQGDQVDAVAAFQSFGVASLGRALQVDSIKTRVESAYGFSA
jgi:hypothetical protein